MHARPSADLPRLSIIDEDSDALRPTPSSPPTTSHRPFSRRWHDKPPAAEYDRSPPTYSVWDVSGPRGERLMDMRNNKYIVRRGGWKRLCIVLVILAAVSIALGVGLGIGLRRAHRDGLNRYLTFYPKQVRIVLTHFCSAAPSSEPQNSTEPFPIGSYSLITNLDVVTANCTANIATWRCYPYTTFATNASQSLAIFNWIISGSPSNLTISSSTNPFSISFANVTLKLEDKGTGSERYSFSTPLDKFVVPDASLTDDNGEASCWFNRTEFTANLYTRKPAAGATSLGSKTDAEQLSSQWTEWPHAIEVNQTIRGGQDVPNCYEPSNGDSRSRISTGLPVQPTNSLCECAWRNFAL